MNINRRSLLRIGALTLGGWLLEGWPAAAAAPRARTVIQLWMSGGPPHLDTFDPKPEAGDGFTGAFKTPIATNVAGIRIGQLLPLLARQADKYSIIRSLTHKNNAHETATYIVQTGTLPSADLAYPAMGAVVAYKRQVEGWKGTVPPFVTLTRKLGRFSEAGFLGPAFQTLATGGDPAAKAFTVEGLMPGPELTAARLQERRALLEAVNSGTAGWDDDDPRRAMASEQHEALERMLRPQGAFDLSQEKDALRDRYGRNTFGQSCLVARRLVEQGVPFITVNFPGWDTHKGHFPAMQKLLPQLDAGFATLLEDLAQRGLLESTIVVWAGEFGRSPRVAWEEPWNGGRHHWGDVFSAVVAGGGFKGGQVVGASDARGEAVKDRPVYAWDLSASIYHLLGIDPTGDLPHPQGCRARVSGPSPGALLKEIM